MVLSFAKKPTGTAKVIPKSSGKCSLIYNGIPVNSADSCRPKGFRLPRFEGSRDFLPAKPKPAYMSKLDISSCFWSLLLPPLWRHIFHLKLVIGVTLGRACPLDGHMRRFYASLLPVPLYGLPSLTL